MQGLQFFYILPFVTLLIFGFVFHKSTPNKEGATVRTYLLFVLYMIPFMDLPVVKAAFGGYKTFDALSYYSCIVLFDKFITTSFYKHKTYYSFLFLNLTLIVLVGSLLSEFQNESLLLFFRLFPVFIYARFLILECLSHPSFYLKVIRVLKISYLISMCFLLVQLIVGVQFSFYTKLHGNAFGLGDSAIRYPSYFYDSQTYGQFLALGSFIFLYIDNEIKKNSTVINYSFFVASVFTLILVGSRSAFGGFGVGLVFLFLFAGSRFRKYGIITVILSASIYAILSPTSGIFSRTENVDEDLKIRSSIWQQAYEIAEAHPYFGIGNGNFQKHTQHYVQGLYLDDEFEYIYFDQPENGYLKILSEFGFIGFGIFLLFFLTPITKALILNLKNNFNDKIIILAAGLVSWLVSFNSFYSLSDNRVLIMVATFLVLIITYPGKNITLNNAKI
jgi:hypothetical protein